MRPRFGGWNPLKALAAVGGVVVGGVVAVSIVGLLVLLFTAIGIATAGLSWLLTYGWIVAAVLIYYAIRRRQAPTERVARHEAEWQRQDDQREREYQRRLQELEECADASRRRSRRTAGTTGTAALAVLSGLVLALGANLALRGLNLSPLANTVLPPLTGAVSGIGVYAALKRWVMPPVDGEKPPAREIKAQIGRIRRKARDLKREANEAGGVFNGLDAKAERLAAEASELADRLFDLRRIARDVSRKAGPANSAGTEASGAGARLDDLLSRNRAAQRRCLAQIERIEDLLDVARLEIVCPDEEMPRERGREELVQEVETELEAARRALAEVQRQSEMV